jgi:hypothetical protein
LTIAKLSRTIVVKRIQFSICLFRTWIAPIVIAVDMQASSRREACPEKTFCLNVHVAEACSSFY